MFALRDLMMTGRNIFGTMDEAFLVSSFLLELFCLHALVGQGGQLLSH